MLKAHEARLLTDSKTIESAMAHAEKVISDRAGKGYGFAQVNLAETMHEKVMDHLKKFGYTVEVSDTHKGVLIVRW